jgi:hypothetical protein
MENDAADPRREQGPTCIQKCVKLRHCIWTLGLSFGFIMAVVGAAFCITQKSDLSIAGVVLSLVGVGLFVATLLFVGLFETAVETPHLPEAATPASLDPEQQGDGFYILDILSEDEDSDHSF